MLPTALREPLEDAIRAGNYYEAYQLHLSISTRLIKQKKFELARTTLASGITLLADNGQIKSVTDLASKFFTAFGDDEVWNESMREISLSILRSLPLSLAWTRQWIDKLICLSKSHQSEKADDLILHKEIGNLFRSKDDGYSAIKHFVKAEGEGQDELNSFLNDFVKHEDFDSATEYLVNSVLLYLKMKRHQEAYQVTNSLIKSVSEIVPPIFSEQLPIVVNYKNEEQKFVIYCTESYPLLNFAQLVIFTLQRNAKADWLKLKSQYSGQLSSNNKILLNEIESIYYPVVVTSYAASTVNMGASLNSMLRNIFSGSGTSATQVAPPANPDID